MTAQVSQPTFAKDSNRRIGMAMGIVTNQRQVEGEDAFDVLRRISQNTNRKLRDIAKTSSENAAFDDRTLPQARRVRTGAQQLAAECGAEGAVRHPS